MKIRSLLLVGLAALVAVAQEQTPMKPPSASAVGPTVIPFLWFEANAEEAAKFYCSLFQNSKIESASPQSVTFQLNGRSFMAINGGPHYKLSPAYSMFVSCQDQAEVDRLWDKLLEGGGKSMQCGWLTDRFGLTWQIIPTRLAELLNDPDPARRGRAVAAMMKMVKIDIAALDRAVAETPK